jgi:hypothetical protein
MQVQLGLAVADRRLVDDLAQLRGRVLDGDEQELPLSPIMTR